MVTIEGQHLTPTKPARVTLHSKNDSTLPPFTCSFVFKGASNPQSLYVRFASGYRPTPTPACPNGFHPSPGLYNLTVNTATGASNSMPIEITTKPVTPIIRYMKLKSGNGAPHQDERMRARVGSQIVVVAYGIDTAGTKARVEQGEIRIPVWSTMGSSSSAWGLGATFILPESLVPGDAQVSIQTFANHQSREWSRSCTFQVIP